MDNKNDLLRRLDNLRLTKTHWTLVIFIMLGAMFDGIEQYNAGYAGPILQKLWGLSGGEVGLITSFTIAGMMVGSLTAGILSDKIGRKVTVIYNLLIYSLATLICAFAPSYTVLLIGRFITGIGLGGEINVGLTYVSEIAPEKKRGSLVAMVNFAIGGVGIFVAAGLAYLILGLLSPLFGGESTSWRWLLGIMVAPALLVFWLRSKLPESPRYLVSKGRDAEAEEVVNMLAEGKLWRIKTSQSNKNVVDQSKDKKNQSFFDVFKGKYLGRTIFMVAFIVLAFGGGSTVTFLLPSLLIAKGFDIRASLLYTMIINFGGMLGALLAVYMGSRVRRKIAISVALIMMVTLAVAIMNSVNTVAIAFAFCFQACNIFKTTTIWLYIPELFPTKIRGSGTGVGVLSSFTAITIFSAIGGSLLGAYGAIGLLSMSGIMLSIAVLTMIIFGKETLGISLEDI